MIHSGRAKYKGKKRFSFKSRELKEFRFLRKFCRETIIDLRSKINCWIEQNSLVVKSLWTFYSNPKTKHQIFANNNINKIQELVLNYNYIQELLVVENFSKSRTRIVQQNMPHELERLQLIFLESFLISILAVYKVSKYSEASTHKIDGKFFKRLQDKKDEFRQEMLKKTRYQKSGKTLKVKKDFPSRVIVTNKILKRLKLELVEETLHLCFMLLRQCNLKTLLKNYKACDIRRV